MMPMRMPAEWAPHERTLMGFPCRLQTFGETLGEACREFADVANAIATFEPVTLVCASEEDRTKATSLVSAGVETVVYPMDGSWLRDNGPIYVTDGKSRRARHFRFNGWGERHAARDRDARLGRTLAESLGDTVDCVDIVLEGGAITTDGEGRMVAPEGCVMHPNRNWYLTRELVDKGLKESLGMTDIIWLGQGLAEDLVRDPERMYYGTDGHVDLFLCFIAPNKVLMLSVADDDPNASHLRGSRRTLENAGMEIVDFPYMSGFTSGGHWYIAPYMNFYICNGGVIVPVCGEEPDKDEEALKFLATLFPDREIVGIQMRAGPMQGGAVHCMTQQVPAVSTNENSV